MDYSAVRAAIVSAIDGAVSGYQVSGYVLGDPTPPAFELTPVSIAYDLTMGRGSDIHRWLVRAYVAATVDRRAQELVEALFEGDAVKGALEADPTLGGLVEGLTVREGRGPIQWPTAAGSVLIGAEWAVEFMAAA